MTNLTDVTNDQLQALKDFASSENKVLVDKLEEILKDVAKTGQYIYPWHFMKPLYACKLDQVTSEFLSTSPPLNNDGTEDEEEIVKLKEFRDKLLQMFDKFVCAPFTIQRVSEMLTNPRKHYKCTAKFFRGLEKNILVVSTIDPVPSDFRPVLKRSLHDENPIEKQNGYVDTELKPQLKKIHLEENTDETKDISEENGGSNGENGAIHGHENNGTSLSEPSAATTASNEGLENMLVCNESVGFSNVTGGLEKTNEVEVTEAAEVDETLNEADVNINEVVENIDTIEENIDPIEENIDTIEENIDPIEENIDPIEENIDTIDENINPLGENINVVDENISQVDANISEVDATISEIDANISEVGDTINEVDENIDEKKEEPSEDITVEEGKPTESIDES